MKKVKTPYPDFPRRRKRKGHRLQLPIGQRFNRLAVLKFARVRDGSTYWLCRCDCGKEKELKGAYIKSGHTVSCGCVRRASIQVGQRFGHWTVLSFGEMRRVGKWQKRKAMWLCRCDCEAKTERLVGTGSLNDGSSQSCGCAQRESATKHGESGPGKRTPEYKAWGSMIARCYNPNCTGYESYGGRGITVCDRWRHSYSNFLADMGRKPNPTHSLDRIDNDGNYEPSNCRWATNQEQIDNRRDFGRIETFPTETLIAEMQRRMVEDNQKFADLKEANERERWTDPVYRDAMKRMGIYPPDEPASKQPQMEKEIIQPAPFYPKRSYYSDRIGE
jgi:hypothetical protein